MESDNDVYKEPSNEIQNGSEDEEGEDLIDDKMQ